MSGKPKVTFSATPMVWIQIVGKHRKKGVRPDDGGLIAEFLEWKAREGIYPAIDAGLIGGGILRQGYLAMDVPKIEAWLTGRGVTKVGVSDG